MTPRKSRNITTGVIASFIAMVIFVFVYFVGVKYIENLGGDAK